MEEMYQFTRYMSSRFRSKTAALKTFYCQEDIREAISQYERAKPDAKPFRRSDLETMCQARDLDMEQLLAEPAILRGLPTREELKGQLLALIYDLHKDAPTPEQNMERIVRQLAPEYSHDPVRVAILKKYVVGLGYDCKTIPTRKIFDWATARMTEAEKTAYDRGEMPRKLSMAVNKLDERIFADFMDIQRLPNEQLLGVIRDRWLRLPELDILLSKADPERCRRIFAFLTAHFGRQDLAAGDYHALCTMAVDHSQQIAQQKEELKQACLRQEDAALAEASGAYMQMYHQTEQRIRELPDLDQIPKEDPLLALVRRYRDNFQARSEDIARKYLQKAHPDLAAQQEVYEARGREVLDFFQYLHALRDAREGFRDGLAALCIQCGIAGREDWDVEWMLNALWERGVGASARETALVAETERAFRHYLNLLFYRTGKSAKIQGAADLLKYAIRDARDANREEYQLLYLCDALARGDFYGNGKTRTELYRFAILFDMTAALRPDDPYDSQRDLAKRLFEDYYSDNMTRFLKASWDNPRDKAQFEAEPSGEGINYKNFVEVVYLYYLYRKDLDLTPGERIDHAQKAIETCARKASRQDSEPRSGMLRETDKTSLYQDRFLDRILEAKERDLPGLILQNYHCGGSGSRIQYTSQANTAYDLLSQTLEDMDEMERTRADILLGIMMDRRDREGNLSDADEKVLRTLNSEAVSSASLVFKWDLFEPLTQRYPEDTDFLRMIRHLNSHLTRKYDWISGRKLELLANLLHILSEHTASGVYLSLNDIRDKLRWKDLAVNADVIKEGAGLLAQLGFDIGQQVQNGKTCCCLQSRTYEDQRLERILHAVRNRYFSGARQLQRSFWELLEEKGLVQKKVTRTALIAAYVNQYTDLMQDTYDLDTFQDLYEDFVSSIDPLLQEARFQPINEKNILDLYVIVSLYYYFVNNGKIGIPPCGRAGERQYT